MKILTRDDILRAVDIPSEDLDIPEWGGRVTVRAMTAGERDRFEIEAKEAAVAGKDPNVRGAVAVRCLVDADGNRLFHDQEACLLAAKHAKPVDRVFEVASRLSGLTREDVKALEKN